MLRYLVQLIGNQRDYGLLSYLAKYLREPSCSIIKEVYGRAIQNLTLQEMGFFLLSSDFDALESTAEVERHANDLLSILNGVVKLKFKIMDSIGVSKAYDNSGDFVASLDDDGDGFLYTTSAGIVLFRTKHSSWRFELKSAALAFQEADNQHPNVVEMWRIARNYPEVGEALHHYGNYTNWFNLYKIYEVIEHDIEKNTLKEWTQGKAEDFTYSANNAHVSGYEACHSSTKFAKASSKRTSMSLLEAEVFVDNLLEKWLNSKY